LIGVPGARGGFAGSLSPLLNAQGFSVDERRIVSGSAIGLYLAPPQGQDGTSRHDAGRADATTGCQRTE
jgi:hypothetical protein